MTEADILRYPTGDGLIDQCTEFMAARLPTLFGPIPRARNDRPCLAEEWWVEAQMSRNISFPLKKVSREDGFRACYRWARNQAIDAGRGYLLMGTLAADLLLHQMAELVPTIIGAAR